MCAAVSSLPTAHRSVAAGEQLSALDAEAAQLSCQAAALLAMAAGAEGLGAGEQARAAAAAAEARGLQVGWNGKSILAPHCDAWGVCACV